MPQRPRSDSGSIVVSGTGRIAVQPDIADVRLGVTVTRPTVDTARAEAGRTMEAILAAVSDAGVARSDVQTSTVSVQPRHDHRDGRAPALVGYEVANVAQVTVRNLARLGAVVDWTLAAGATSLDGLTFRIANPAPAEREARVRAMAEARSRAEVLADAAGVTIEGVIEIVEGERGRPPMPFPKAERMAMSADGPTPVEGGTIEVAVTVTVTFRVG
jgi:uncharacterized protein YggE